MYKETVVFLTNEYFGSRRAGGIASYVYNLSTVLSKKNYEVIVLSANDNIFRRKNFYLGNVRYTLLPFGDFFVGFSGGYISKIISKTFEFTNWYILRYLYYVELKKLYSCKKIVYVESTDFGNEGFFLTRRNLKIRLVKKFHISDMGSAKKVRQLYFDSMNFYKLSFPSNFYLKYVENKFQYLDLDMSVLPEMVIRTNMIQVRDNVVLNKSLNYDLCYFGTISLTKGSMDLFNAILELGLDIREKLNIILAGKLSSNIQLGEMKKYYVGLVNSEDVLDFYEESKIAVFPSFFENQSMSLIEAISCGCLIIISDIPSHLELTRDIIGVYSYPVGNWRVLSALIKSTLEVDSLSQEEIAHNRVILNARVGFSRNVKILESDFDRKL